MVLFLKHAGDLLTRDRITRALWDEDVIVIDNALTTQIKNLRSRIGPYGKRLQTLTGEGYRFDDSNEG